MSETARRAFVVTAVVVAVVAAAFALWKLKVLLAILFFGFVVAAAMRPGVERLHDLHVPRIIGILLHYAALAGAIALLLFLVVPVAQDQISKAVPTSASELKQQTRHSSGIKHEILSGIQKRLQEFPSGSKLVSPVVETTKRVFEILIGIFLAFATGAYWIYERDRVERLVVSLLPRRKRRVVRDTWNLIDLKLGAYVRAQLLLVAMVATTLSLLFWLIGLRFWLLVGVFAGIVEMVPVVGPLTAGAVAVAVGLTSSWQVAVAAAIVVFAVRMLQDYVIVPRVMGSVVGLTPLTVLFAVSAIAILFGGWAVLLATPFTAVIATVVEVIVLKRDPADGEQPTVLFPAKESAGGKA